MATKKGSNTSDVEWVRAGWEIATEMQQGLGHRVQLSGSPTNRLGVWRWEARQLHAVDGRPVSVAVKVWDEYPTASHISFPAFLHALLHKLDAAIAAEVFQSAPDSRSA